MRSSALKSPWDLVVKGTAITISLIGVMVLLFTSCWPRYYIGEELVSEAFRGDLAAIRRLHSLGGDVNTRIDDGGWTALMAASANDNLDCVVWLLQNGADPKIKNEDGDTACNLAKSSQVRQVLGCPR